MHSSVFAAFSFSRSWGKLEPIPNDIGREVGYTASVQTPENYYNLESPISLNPICMSLD